MLLSTESYVAPLSWKNKRKGLSGITLDLALKIHADVLFFLSFRALARRFLRNTLPTGSKTLPHSKYAQKQTFAHCRC